jgi:hypothetical protein
MKNPIDINKIREAIQKEHTKFIANLGPQIEKVNADHKLLEEMTISKIKYVLDIFLGLKVIDTCEESLEGPLKKLKLVKSGTDNFIIVTTNGLTTTVTGFNYFTSFASSDSEEKIQFYNMWSDDFDWLEFSTKLLDFIHSIVYERKHAFDTKIKTMMEDTGN